MKSHLSTFSFPPLRHRTLGKMLLEMVRWLEERRQVLVWVEQGQRQPTGEIVYKLRHRDRRSP